MILGLIFITLILAFMLITIGYRAYNKLKKIEHLNQNKIDNMSVSVIEVIFGRYESEEVQKLQKKTIKSFTIAILLILSSLSLVKHIN